MSKEFFRQDHGGVRTIKMTPDQYNPSVDKDNPWFGRHNETVYRKNSGPTVPDDFEFEKIIFRIDDTDYTLVGAVEGADYSKYGINFGVCKIVVDGKTYRILYV